MDRARARCGRPAARRREGVGQPRRRRCPARRATPKWPRRSTCSAAGRRAGDLEARRRLSPPPQPPRSRRAARPRRAKARRARPRCSPASRPAREMPGSTGQTYGVVGISASTQGAGIVAMNSLNGTDLFLEGAGNNKTDALLTESYLDRPSIRPETFDFRNSGGSTMALQVGGVAVDLATTPIDWTLLASVPPASPTVSTTAPPTSRATRFRSRAPRSTSSKAPPPASTPTRSTAPR